MKNMLKRGLSLALALIMVVGLMPVTAFAAVDSSGKPTDTNNTLVLSIYTGEGFPGEPAVYGTSNYKNITSSFEVRSGATFASSAKDQLDWEKVKKDLVQGPTSGSTSVWGVNDANGTKDYFLPGASIINRDNEIKMIRAAKNCTAAEAENYEIIWYVIKLQHNPGSGWFSRATTEWHIDGVVKEKTKISINYYGNGNTSGDAPIGVTDHTAGALYTVQDQNTMKKKINGVEVAFLGWSAKADGSGAEAGFYKPGDKIYPTESISLYAMWDTTTQYTATVNTYLNGVLTDDSDIHRTDRNLYLGTEGHYYQLTRSAEGVYTVKITGNGKFHLFNKNADGTYKEMPIISDVCIALKQMLEPQDDTDDRSMFRATMPKPHENKREVNELLGIMQQFITGTYSFLNRHTNIKELDNDYTVFDISDLDSSGDKIVGAMMFTIINHIMNLMTEDITQRKIVLIDELWKLVGEGSGQTAAFVKELYKIIRAYNGCVITASQDIQDWHSKDNESVLNTIINNSQFQVLLKMQQHTLGIVSDKLYLNAETRNQISMFSRRGDAMLICENNAFEIRFDGTPTEHMAITTDPNELAVMRMKIQKGGGT